MAATFFGEVVKVRSRAVTEEEEEEEEPWVPDNLEDREVRRELERKREVEVLGTQTKVSLEIPLLEQYPCSKFIMAVGHNAVAFLSSFVMNSETWEEIGSTKLWNEWCRTRDTTNLCPTDAFCVFYRLKSDPTVFSAIEEAGRDSRLRREALLMQPPVALCVDDIVLIASSPRTFYSLLEEVFLCQCSCYVAEDQQYQWLEKVFGSSPKRNLQITILTSRHVTDYKSPESSCNLPSPFLKALKTQSFPDAACCTLLEQPNIVHDLPAAVLSYCQVWKIPAILYLCYTDIMKLDLVTVEAFKPILGSTSLKGLVKNVSHGTEVLKKLVTTNEIQSNIYT